MPYENPTPVIEATKAQLVVFGIDAADVFYPRQSFEAGETSFPSYTLASDSNNWVTVGPGFSIEQTMVEIQIRNPPGTTVGQAEIAARSLMKQFINAGPGLVVRNASYEEGTLPDLPDDLQTTDVIIVLETGLEPTE